jgi:uncharacterized SAM-binding protein YcdF (DUF218 family)
MTFNKVIIELGGNAQTRMPKTVELATSMPDAFVLVSSEENPSYCLSELKAGGINPDRFYLDYTAWDTVTNFTCTVRRIKNLGCKELYIVTDGFHMRRALCIAKAVYFRSGISLKAAPATPVDHKEKLGLIILDSLRAWLWRFTGQILASQSVYDDRVTGLQNDYYTARQLQQGV